MNNNLSFGQRIDPQNGYVESWFTHGALDEIKQIDLSNKIVWMWGSGRGDTWLAKRCKELHVVERVEDWIYQNAEMQVANGIANVRYYHRPCNEGSGAQEMYCLIPENINPDVFIVDDAYRYECILKAIEKKPCLLIVDNFMQDFVFICPSAVEALKGYKGKYFIQPDHEDHEGSPWQTAIWELK